jgi:hypothetical protein
MAFVLYEVRLFINHIRYFMFPKGVCTGVPKTPGGF